ncbi:MAG: pectate lyase [Rhodocyclaceae bacterium]
MKSIRIALAAMAAALSFNASAANRPAGYVTLCSEGKTCSVSSSTKVAFGRADKFFYKQLTGSFVCNEATFGGRVAGGTNECSVPKSSASSSSSSSSSSVQPPVASNYTFCAAPGKTCSFTGTRMVQFWDCTPSGTCGAISSKFTGQMLCDISSYGGGSIGMNPVGCWYGPDITPLPPPPPGTPPASITGGSCVSTGTVKVTTPILVTSGTYDAGCKTYVGQFLASDESTKPVFRVENGATLKNAIITIDPKLDNHGGVHVYAGGTVENVTWLSIQETGLTIKTAGSVIARNLTVANSADRFLQINAASKISVQNCVIDHVGQTVVRQNGGTTFKTDVTLDACRIAGPAVSVFRSDSPSSIAKLLNSYVHMAGQVCYGTWASCSYTNSYSY